MFSLHRTLNRTDPTHEKFKRWKGERITFRSTKKKRRDGYYPLFF